MNRSKRYCTLMQTSVHPKHSKIISVFLYLREESLLRYLVKINRFFFIFYVSIIIFGLRMMVKNGLKKSISKLLHAGIVIFVTELVLVGVEEREKNFSHFKIFF